MQYRTGTRRRTARGRKNLRKMAAAALLPLLGSVSAGAVTTATGADVALAAKPLSFEPLLGVCLTHLGRYAEAEPSLKSMKRRRASGPAK
jgi:hypothetical protein